MGNRKRSRPPALGSSPLDAVGVNSSDHPVDKLLRGKASTNELSPIVEGQLPTAIPYDPNYIWTSPLITDYLINGPIIAWKCSKCHAIYSTLIQSGNLCHGGSKHSLEPVRAKLS